MRYDAINRRMFLQGAAGSLAIPLLPSLLSRKARAQGSLPQPTLIMLSTDGGLSTQEVTDMHPVDAPTETQHTTIYHPYHKVPWNSLAAMPPMLEPLAWAKDKFSFVSGLAIPFRMTHNTDPNTFKNVYCGGMAGNMAMGKHGLPIPESPTLDQLVLEHVAQAAKPHMVIGRGGSFARDPADPTKANQVAGTTNPFDIYYRYFGDGSITFDPTDSRLFAIDKVYQDYRNILNSPKLSSEDKLVLDSHAQLLSDVAGRLQRVSGVACTEPSEPIDDDWVHSGWSDAQYRDFIDATVGIVAAVVRCGLVNSVRIHSHYIMANSPDLHEAQHKYGESSLNSGARSTAKTIMTAWVDRWFSGLLKHLDVSDGNGGTVLDHCVVAGFGEFTYNHIGYTLGALVAGGADNRLNQGYWYDYGNRALSESTLLDAGYDSADLRMWKDTGSGFVRRRLPYGYPWSSFLRTIGQAAGMPASAVTAAGWDDVMTTQYYSSGGNKEKAETIQATIGGPANNHETLPGLYIG